MAVKPITDRQLVDKTTVNRETQTSQRDCNNNSSGGNVSKTLAGIAPSLKLSKNEVAVISKFFLPKKRLISPSFMSMVSGLKKLYLHGIMLFSILGTSTEMS